MSKETHAVIEDADVPAEVRDYLGRLRDGGWLDFVSLGLKLRVLRIIPILDVP